jgi:hypothetical protein
MAVIPSDLYTNIKNNNKLTINLFTKKLILFKKKSIKYFCLIFCVYIFFYFTKYLHYDYIQYLFA